MPHVVTTVPARGIGELEGTPVDCEGVREGVNVDDGVMEAPVDGDCVGDIQQ